jgi:Anti-sigma-K factor rskA/Putative zinc-finger
MGPHDEFLELCAASTSGELSQDERRKLDEHLAGCSSCRSLFEQYRTTVETAIPLIASTLPQQESASDLNWSVDRAEAALFERIAKEENSTTSIEFTSKENQPPVHSGRRAYIPSGLDWSSLWMSYAAGMVLVLALGITVYRLESRRIAPTVASTSLTRADQRGIADAEDSKMVPPTAAETNPAGKANGLSDEGHERQTLVAELAERDRQITNLQQRMDQQSAELAVVKSKAEALSAAAKSNGVDQQAEVAKRTSSVQDSAALQARVEDLQKELSAAQEQLVTEAARRTAVEVKLADQETKISQQQELLAHDRDIRELMGARDLYVAEVYDVGKSGETSKPYGRVFYTKGKSLVFYAYDLDQQPGLQNVGSFQAWGRRGSDKNQAVNLGVFYEDSASKKRWILKFDDPKTLTQIDEVFVTAEPDGGSRHPSGKRILFAYLRIDPNHP